MNKAETLLTHLTFNPMMNFIDNDVSRWLLFALCLSGILRSILCWRHSGREEAGEERS